MSVGRGLERSTEGTRHRPSRRRGRGIAAVPGRGPDLDRPPAQRGPRHAGHRAGPAPAPAISRADEGRPSPGRPHAQARAGLGQGRAGWQGPGEPQGRGGPRFGGALIPSTSAGPRRRRRWATAGPCRGCGSSSDTRPRKGGGSTPWRPIGSPLRPQAPPGGLHGPADLGLARPDRVPQGPALVEGASCGGAGQRRLAHQPGDPGVRQGPGRWGDRPALPAAVLAGAGPDRAGLPPGQAPGDPGAGPHDSGRASRGRRGGLPQLRSEAPHA